MSLACTQQEIKVCQALLQLRERAQLPLSGLCLCQPRAELAMLRSQGCQLLAHIAGALCQAGNSIILQPICVPVGNLGALCLPCMTLHSREMSMPTDALAASLIMSCVEHIHEEWVADASAPQAMLNAQMARLVMQASWILEHRQASCGQA